MLRNVILAKKELTFFNPFRPIFYWAAFRTASTPDGCKRLKKGLRGGRVTDSRKAGQTKCQTWKTYERFLTAAHLLSKPDSGTPAAHRSLNCPFALTNTLTLTHTLTHTHMERRERERDVAQIPACGGERLRKPTICFCISVDILFWSTSLPLASTRWVLFDII